MRVRTDSSTDGHLVELIGRFDAHELTLFRTAVDPLVAAPSPQLRIDLANVVFVDSSALAELLRVQKEVSRQNGTLILQDVSDPVRVILEITALEQVFTVQSSAGPNSTPATVETAGP